MSTDTAHAPSPPARRVTSEEVLTVLTDLWRIRHSIDPQDQYESPLTRETDVESAANHIGVSALEDHWVDIATIFRSIFRIDLEKDEWKALIHPKRQRTLGPLCDVIAEHALAPLVVRDFEGMRLDWPTAVFRALILVLRDAGFDVEGIRPGTRISRLLDQNPRALVVTLARLSPGCIPAPRRSPWVRRFGFCLVAVLAALAIVELLFRPHLKWNLIVIGAGLATVAFMAIGPRFLPFGTRLGHLRTMKDLCYALSAPPPPSGEPLTDERDAVIRWDRDQHPI